MKRYTAEVVPDVHGGIFSRLEFDRCASQWLTKLLRNAECVCIRMHPPRTLVLFISRRIAVVNGRDDVIVLTLSAQT